MQRGEQHKAVFLSLIVSLPDHGESPPGTHILCFVVITVLGVIRAKAGVLNMSFASSLFFGTLEACVSHPHGEVEHRTLLWGGMEVSGSEKRGRL